METLFKELLMPALATKQRLVVWYFVLSLMLLCVADDASLWMLGFVVLNFGNAARLINGQLTVDN